MLTYTKRVLLNENAAGDRLWYLEGHCLAADTKPTSDIANGSQLIEMDSGSVYFFDEEGGDWVEFAEPASSDADTETASSDADTEPAEEET